MNPRPQVIRTEAGYMLSRCFMDDMRASSDKLSHVPPPAYLSLERLRNPLETETAKVAPTSAAQSPAGPMCCQLSSKCVIVADYKLHVFTRTSCAPACSSNFSTHVEAITPPCELKLEISAHFSLFGGKRPEALTHSTPLP